MTPPLFRAKGVPELGGIVVLDGPEGRHAGAALRLAPGECLLLGDGHGHLAECTVTSSEAGRVAAVVDRVRFVPPPATRVTVVQALPKSERSELAVELATEAGADRIVPWQAERCVSRWSGVKIAKGHTKWVNAARAAAKQSRRAWEPEIADLVTGAGLCELVFAAVAGDATVLLLHEAGALPLAEAVERAGCHPEHVILIIGPEGGISETELSALAEAGAQPALLGPEVLRTSTAAAVALGALGVLTGRWENLPNTPTTLAES